MSANNIIFNDKKISKSNFYKNKKLSMVDEIDFGKILISKKESYSKKNPLKCFIMMMMSLDHYV